MSYAHHRILLISGAVFVASLGGCQSEEIAQHTAALTSVSWMNVVGVTTSGNSLTKTAANGWGNAGAASVETLDGVIDGYLEFSTSEATTYKMAGLSNGDTNQNYDDIDFAFYMMGDGTLRIWEAGQVVGTFGTYSAGDTLRIEVVNGVVRYLKNGALLHTSSRSPTFPLLVDTALWSTGATIDSVVIDNVFWNSPVGVSTVLNGLIKTGGFGWNAGAASLSSISVDGYTEFSTDENTSYKMAGLSNGDTDQSYGDIDFAIYMHGDGSVRIWESGTSVGNFGTYNPGDVFRVAVENGVVNYYQNGALLHTSSSKPVFPLLVDTSLWDAGATITNVKLVETYWSNPVGVSVVGDDITKTGANGWNAGAVTTQTLSSDGYAEFTTSESNTYKMAGLSNGDTDQSYSDIDFAFYLMATGELRIWENGAPVGSFGTYSGGDVFRVQNEGGVVTYWQNGSLLYTSTHSATSPLLLDTSLWSNGSTINNVVLEDLFWTNAVNVNATFGDLFKTGPNGWNAGASTLTALSQNGSVQFTTAEANTYKMAGLSNGDTDQSYQDIDYGIYMMGDGNLRIWEFGALIGDFGTYQAGDVFRIDLTDGVVSYYQNDVLLHTSPTAATLPLVLDTALFSSGATIQNVNFTLAP